MGRTCPAFEFLDCCSRTEESAGGFVRANVTDLQSALEKPNSRWLNEDYYIVHLREARDRDGKVMSGAQLPAERCGEIALLVRGEVQPLGDQERAQALRACLSYYPNDLVVIGWSAAFVYHTPTDAAPAVQLLEYANTQLLEFRFYDEALTNVLRQVYRSMERRATVWSRWGMARGAVRLNALRRDMMELT